MTELNLIAGDYANLTKPIVDFWNGQITRAKEAKKTFQLRGDQIMAFYSGGPTAMWQPSFMANFMGGQNAISQPKFKITLNIAFEQVAIMGPLLFWEMADIKCSPHPSIHIDIEALAGGDQRAAQAFEEMAQQQAMTDARNGVRANLLQPVLNYFQREQPAGLSAHSALAVFEMLTRGAGFLRTEEYQFPFSEKTYVGNFFQTVEDVFVDADCNDPMWQTANYIAIRHRTKAYQLEEHFGLQRGSLNGYAALSSQSANFEIGAVRDAEVKVQHDLIEWYEIYSRAGFGNLLAGRLKGPTIAPEFDAARGGAIVNGKYVKDTFAYLCICPLCPYPLNLPANLMTSEMATPEWVKSQTDWPTEYWRDNKWPIEMLSVYPHSGTSPWPEPPLAPAIGELTCLNILMSAYVEQAWNSRQTVVGYQKGAIQNLQNLLNSDTSVIGIEIDPNINMNATVDQLIKFMERPEVNGDLLQSIQFVIGLIEKRTGLSPVLYGQQEGAEPRSATAYQGRQDTVNIRPDYMRKKVAEWQSNVADKSVFCAYTHVDSQSISDFLGPLGSVAWNMLITEESPEEILRGTSCIVEASDIRRPNKSKDVQDMKELQQYWLPIAEARMAQDNNVAPLNGFLETYGDAAEIDVSKMLLPETPPDPIAQQMQEAELQKTQAEAAKFNAEAQAVGAKGEEAMQSAQIKAQSAEHAAMLKQQTAEHAMSVKERQAQLAETSRQQEIANRQDDHALGQNQRLAEARQKLGLQLMQAQQGLHQSAATHFQQTAIANTQAQQDAARGNLITAQKILNMRAEQANRASQQGGSA